MITEQEIAESGSAYGRYGNGSPFPIPRQDPKSGSNPKIVVIFPRGETLRNFLYTGTLEHLGHESDVHLITVQPGSEIEGLLSSKCTAMHSLEKFPEKWVVRFEREILEAAHNRWLWTRAAKERSRLRDLEARSVREKVIRRLKKAVSFMFASRIGLRALSKIERVSSRVFGSTHHYEKLYKEIKPNLVFNASHVHSRNATQAVEAAQWMGIPTATFIFSWDNLTSQGRISLPYDHFIVWNEALKGQLLEMYDWIESSNVFVTGTPQFDSHFQEEFYESREDYCDRIGADESRPIVLYTTGMANHMPGEPEIVEGIADLLEEYPKPKRPQLVVRVYAKDLTGRFDELRQRRSDILFADPIWEPEWLTPKYEDSFALVNALRHCSVGINVASTLSLELCMFDKPVINVGYNPRSVATKELAYADYYEFDHYKPVVESGAVQVATDIDEMRELISQAISTPETRKKNRRQLIEQIFGDTLDGRSSVRVSEVLSRIAARS